jgi:cytochrome c-type biogenesis protein
MTAEAPTRRRSARTWLAAGLSVAVLALAVAAGLLSSPTSMGPLIAVASLSARLSGALLALGTAAPLGYGFIAGMIAAVNPCGFVLLPAYLGYYLGERQDAASAGRRTARAIVVSATVTASFALLFGLAGIVVTLTASAVSGSLAWVGAAVGVALILLAGLVAAGREPNLSVAPRAAQRLQVATRVRGLSGYAAYGLAYGLASLGCTLPVFLGVVGTSLQLHGPLAAVGQFLLFAAGMGVVLTVATLATAWFGDGVIKQARSLSRYIAWASAVLLWLGGAYVVYYWLTTTRLL